MEQKVIEFPQHPKFYYGLSPFKDLFTSNAIYYNIDI